MIGKIGKIERLLLSLFLAYTLGVVQGQAQTVVLPGDDGESQTFERPELSQDEGLAQKMSWETLQLGEIQLDLPTTYELSLDRGDILGHPYFAKFAGRSYPDIFVMDTVFQGDIEELGNSFYRNYLQPRFQLRSQHYLAGTPRKLALDVQGMEMRYLVYFVSLNQRNAFLIFVVPVPPKTDYAVLAEQLIKTVRFY